MIRFWHLDQTFFSFFFLKVLKDISPFCGATAVADPGFPRGGGANSPGGAPTYDFAKFSQKLHEIERIWTPGGGGGASKILLCRSATALIPLFWTSGDVSSGFQSQSGQPYSCLAEVHMLHVPRDSPLV